MVGAVAVALVVVTVLVVVGHRERTSPATVPSAAPSDTPPARTTTTTTTPRPPYPVGSLVITVSLPASGDVPARSFPTYVRYPARTGSTTAGAPLAPLPNPGPFPLVVFSGGYDVSPEVYSNLLDAWAAAGFVVADPVYPFTTPSPGQELDEGDIVHHPADLSAVITALLTADRGAATGAEGVLAGAIDSGSVAVVGHSDGGDVSLAAGANTCCRDPRVRAAVILSGAEDSLFPGTYFPVGTALPLLVVQGTADEVNPPGCSVQLYDRAPPPKYYLSLEGQTHQSPYLQAGTAYDTVQQVVEDFLSATLESSGPARAAMERDGNVPGSSTLTGGGPSGVPTGSCPGAPDN